MKSKNCIKTTKLSYFMTVLLSVFMMQFGFAQESKTVSGTITSAEDGFGVPGATVQVQGTKSSTVTDFDGKYKVEAKTGDVLVITFVGFKTQNITVGAQKVVNAVLQPETAELKEIVVIGYGTQKKKVN